MASIKYCLMSSIITVIIGSSNFFVNCNPLLYEPSSLMGASPFHHHQMMFASPQFDPYSMAAANHYMYPPNLFMPYAFDSSRRYGGPPIEATSIKNRHTKKLTDEQKALGDIPVSFLDNDEPSTLTERLTDSLSAIGDGVKNHFRSISENFSDTVDDIREAWRPSGNSKKRG